MKGRPVRGFFEGLFLGIFVDIDLVFGGVVKLDSVVLTILPIVLLVLGLLLGLWAPVGRSRPVRSDPMPAPPAPERATVPAPEPAAADPAAPATLPEDTPPI